MSRDIDILARTIYGEARGEFSRPEGGVGALIGVANVVMNRVRKQSWFGKTIKEVCQKPYQFSCWNESDPNRPLLLSVTPENYIFRQCLEVARNVAQKTWPDLTKGSDHYYAIWLPRSPVWALGKKPVAKIGSHIFYRLAPDLAEEV
tara:strand:+ start:189 stop:629 length:441 start_codon:yes stop_codon:yes gene_type:complete